VRIGISCYPSQGGSGVVATELGKALAARDHEIHFITSSLPVRLREFDRNIFFHEVQPENYPVFLHPPYSLSLAAKMAEVAETYDLDVLHAHYAMPHAACAYLAKQMLRGKPIKTVTTLHGTDITLIGQAPSFYKVTKFSIEESDCVSSVSRWLADETRRSFHTTRPIHVVPNFVDTEVFRPQDVSERRRCFAEPGEKVVLHISNFRPVKNIGAVIDVFRHVAGKFPARLLLVGDGPERIPVEIQVREAGLQDRVRFLGGQEYVEDLLPLADVFLLPSLHESFGLVVLEAMASGVPVVATEIGGTSEVVQEGVCGYLRNPHDVPGMVDAVSRILDDGALAARLGAEGRRIAEEQYRVEHVLPGYLALYGDC